MADSAAFGKSRRKSKVLGQITHDARTDSLFYVKIHPVTHCKLKIESAKTGVPIIHQEQVPVIVPDEKTGAGVPEDRAQIQLEKIALSKFSGVNLNAMEMARPWWRLMVAGLPQAVASWLIGKLWLWHWRRTLGTRENESRVAEIHNYLVRRALACREEDASEVPILSGHPGWIDLCDVKPRLVRQL